MSTDLKKLMARCPKCKMTVGLRPGKRLLKHGHSDDPYRRRPPCALTGEKVTDADILAWVEGEVSHRAHRADVARQLRERAEAALSLAHSKEQTAEQELRAAQAILAEYKATVTICGCAQ